MQACYLKNGLAQTVLGFLYCAEAKSGNSRVTALAKTTLVSSPQACHSPVLKERQRVIGFLCSPVRLTLSQAQGSKPALTPKATTLDLVTEAKRYRQENKTDIIDSMELPLQTCMHNITPQAQIKI